jgi:hypothetical protein
LCLAGSTLSTTKGDFWFQKVFGIQIFLQFTKQASAAKAPSALGQNVENISFAVPLLFLYRFTAQAENKVLAQGAFRRQRPLTFVKSHWSFNKVFFLGAGQICLISSLFCAVSCLNLSASALSCNLPSRYCRTMAVK